MLQVMEAGIGNTNSAAPTAKILRLPDRAARGAPEGLELVRAAYEAAGGSCARPLEMRPLARRLGLEPRAVENLVMRLQAERLVRVVSMANGLLRITPEGVRAAESANERVVESAAIDSPESAASGPDPTTPIVGRGALRELGEMLGPLKAGLDRLDLAGVLDGERCSELAAEVRTIEAQLGSPRPKLRIVAAALESVADVAGSAAGGAGSETESERILRAIDEFLDGTGGAGRTGQAAQGAGGAAGEAAGEARAGRVARGARNGAGLARPGGDLADEDGPGTRHPEEEEEGFAATHGTREAGGVRVRKRVRGDGGRAAEWARGAGRPASGGAHEAVGEAGEGTGSAAEDVGAGGDQAVRGAAGAAARAGEAADRAGARETEAGRRVLRVVETSGDVLRTTLNGDGEILDEEVVGNVADPPVEGRPEDGGRVAGRGEEGSGPPIRPRSGEDGGVPDPRTPPPATAGETVEGSGHGSRPREAERRTDDRDAGDPPARFPRRTVDGARGFRGDSLWRTGGRGVPAVSIAGGADGDALRSATAAEGRELNKKRPVSDGEFGTKDRGARTQEYGGEEGSEGTQNVQQQSQEDQYLQQAQDFFAQSIGRIKGRMQSDSAQLESIMQQLPEGLRAQVQEMTDSYAQFEGVMDQAAQEARQNADQATGQGQEPVEQAADQAEEVAEEADEAEDETGQMADNLPEGFQAMDEPATDEEGKTVLQGHDEQGNTVDSTYDQQGNLMSQAPVENGSDEPGEQGIEDSSSSDSDTTTVEQEKGGDSLLGLLGGGLLSLDLPPPKESTTTTVEPGDSEDYDGPAGGEAQGGEA